MQTQIEIELRREIHNLKQMVVRLKARNDKEPDEELFNYALLDRTINDLGVMTLRSEKKEAELVTLASENMRLQQLVNHLSADLSKMKRKLQREENRALAHG